MRIKNTQKKELFEIFQKVGLNIFEFETSGEYQEFNIKFKYDYFSFKIEMRKEDAFYLTIFPVNNTAGYSVGATWENTKSRFISWTKQIYEELNTATGWNTFENVNYLNADYQDLHDKFTESEKHKTRLSISEVRERVKTLDLSEDALQIIQQKLDHLSEKVDSLSKFDWKSLFLGTIANLIMTLAIPSNAAGLLWLFIKNAFSGLKLVG